MTLKEHIDDIRESLEKGLFTSEADVCDNIVRRLLHEGLGWPRYKPDVVIREYSVEGGEVDFALCHPPSQPRIFIEAKRVGNIEGGEEQLFRYAFRRGVPIAILTDGQQWHFFYPIGEGNYRERKVHEMDLTEGDNGKNAEKLNRYLNYESICTGEAVETIKEDYEEVAQQRQVVKELPEIWSELVQERNDYLLLAVMEKAKKKIGYEPTEEQVLNFLKSLERKTEVEIGETQSPPMPTSTFSNRKPKLQPKTPAKRLIVTMPNGEVIQHYNAMDTFREVIFKLGPEKVLQVDRECILISTEPISKRRTTFYRGYYITENHGTPTKQKLLERIAARLGINMRVETDDKP